MPSLSHPVVNGLCLMELWVFNPSAPFSDQDIVRRIEERHAFTALLSTGSARSAISERAFNKLGLSPDGKQSPDVTVDEIDPNDYGIDLMMPKEYNAELSLEPFSREWLDIRVSKISNPDDNYDILLGMDIIKDCELVVARGEFVLFY